MDSCILNYFFLGGTGLPGWLPRVPTGLVVTGPRPPVEGAGLPGWLPRTGWV
jgi:hypothetical protein